MKHISLGLIFLFVVNVLFAQQFNNRLSLNGKWEIIFDEQNDGRTKKWFINNNFENHTEKREINVPSCWEEYEKN